MEPSNRSDASRTAKARANRKHIVSSKRMNAGMTQCTPKSCENTPSSSRSPFSNVTNNLCNPISYSESPLMLTGAIQNNKVTNRLGDSIHRRRNDTPGTESSMIHSNQFLVTGTLPF